MRPLALILAAVLGLVATRAAAAPVLMISIDGRRPLDVLQASERAVPTPHLARLTREGVAVRRGRDALPGVTYPNHTTLVTAVWAGRHGIGANTTFDPRSRI